MRLFFGTALLGLTSWATASFAGAEAPSQPVEKITQMEICTVDETSETVYAWIEGKITDIRTGKATKSFYVSRAENKQLKYTFVYNPCESEPQASITSLN